MTIACLGIGVSGVASVAIGEAYLQRLFGTHRPPGENHVQGATLPDDARQAHRTAVYQRHPPAPAENT